MAVRGDTNFSVQLADHWAMGYCSIIIIIGAESYLSCNNLCIISTTYMEDQSQTDNDVEYSITNLPYPRQMSSLEKYCHLLLGASSV